MNLLKEQKRVAKEHFNQRIFLEGKAGTGKTTAAIERVKNLIKSGVPSEQILILVPQQALALPYETALQRARLASFRPLVTETLGSLALKMLDLFYPLIAKEIGFKQPKEKPHFLSLELVQYYMTRFIEPEIEARDYFNSVHINRNRLYTQIVDNLNKAALVGFDYQTLSERLKSAWRGEVSQAFIYEDAQACANLFREKCYEFNLMDFSLQVECFTKILWKKKKARDYLTQQFRHLIVDNSEEDSPATHDLLKEWLPDCESALVIYDSEAGYRRFLGSDPNDAYELKKRCEVHIELKNHRVMSPDMEALESELALSLKHPQPPKAPKDSNVTQSIIYTDQRYHPQMVDWSAEQVADLVHNQGVAPQEIVLLAPFLPDALRFALQTRLDELGVPHRSHRPSRALREEPAARTLLTFAKLAHPDWGMAASKYDVAYALTHAIQDLDLVRSRLLVDALYHKGLLAPFEQITNEAFQQRITFELGLRYERLRQWLTAYQASPLVELDLFLSRFFGEILSQADFAFHASYDAANTAANLIDSARQFRQIVSRIEPNLPIAPEYIRMVDKGVIANQYIRSWESQTSDAVLIAPAYTYLMLNQPVDYQFWLNVGSAAWAQRLYQPLTHPHVLSRTWKLGQIWTDDDEEEANQEALRALILGLVRRCRKQVYLGLSQYGEQGFEQRGSLLLAVQSMLRRQVVKEGNDV